MFTLPRLLILVALPLVAGCAPDRFLSTESGVQRDIRGIHAVKDGVFWLVGEAGLIMRYDGETFVDTSSDADPGPGVPNLYDVTDLQGDLTIVGDDGLVLKADGLEFVRDDNRDSQRLLTAFRAGPRTLFAGGESGRVRRRTKDGGRWESVAAGASDARITGGWALSEASAVLCTDRGTVIEHIEDEWVTQTVATETSSVPLPLFAVWSSTAGADLVTVGLAGSIFRRASGQDVWKQEPSGTTQDLYALYGSRSDDLYAVGARGTILHYDGVGWLGVPSSTAQDLYAIEGSLDGATLLAGGAQGAVVILRR